MLRNRASIQPTRRPYCGSWNSTSTQSASSLSTCRNVPFAATRRGTLAPGATKIGAASVTVAVGNGGAWIAPTATSAADINMNIQAPSMTFFSATGVIVPVESGYRSCGARGGSRQCNGRSALSDAHRAGLALMPFALGARSASQRLAQLRGSIVCLEICLHDEMRDGCRERRPDLQHDDSPSLPCRVETRELNEEIGHV